MSKDRKPAPVRRLLPPWTGMTLPGLVQGSATLRPDAPAVVEPDNTEGLIGRKARLLTCKGLLVETDLLAQKLRALGLKAGDVVLVHLPNTADALLTLLAIQKAGGIPAPLPVFEDRACLAEAARLINAAAIITMASFAGLTPAETCRDAAIDALNVRFVAAFGRDLPEGVAALDDWDTVEFLTAAAFPKLDGPDAALITFDRVDGALRALVRTHEHLVAEAAAAASLARIATGNRVLATVPPASAAGVIYGIALPLLTGAWVELNALFDSAGFAAQLGAGDKTTVILPGTAEVAYRRFRGTRAIKAEHLVLIHRPEADGPLPDLSGEANNPRIVDVIGLGEAACMSLVRKAGARPLPLLQAHAYPVAGVLAAASAAVIGSALDNGKLALSGPLVPNLLHSGAADLATEFAAGSTLNAPGMTMSPESAVSAA